MWFGGKVVALRGSSLRVHSDCGASLVEVAITLPLFCLLLFGVIEFSRLAFVQLSLQYSLNRTARHVVLAQHSLNEVQMAASAEAADFGLKLNFADDSQLAICAGEDTNCVTPLAQTPSRAEKVILKLQKRVPLFVSLGTYNVSATVIARNEPYAAS